MCVVWAALQAVVDEVAQCYHCLYGFPGRSPSGKVSDHVTFHKWVGPYPKCAVGGACIPSVRLLQKLSSHASDKVSGRVRGREGRGQWQSGGEWRVQGDSWEDGEGRMELCMYIYTRV